MIVSPDYRRSSGGITVLHRLCHELRQRGHEAFIRTNVTNPAWNTPAVGAEEARKLARDGAIVIYPEVVTGNPLHARRVVRYVLNTPGFLGGEKTYDPHECVYAFSKPLYRDGYKGILFIPVAETDIFHPPTSPENRSGGVFWVGKGADTPRIRETKRLTEITRTWPATREELAELFRTKEVFYSYDNLTGLTEEARLCGCPVVIIPSGQFQRSHYENYEVGMDGLAWGPGELDRARRTMGRFWDHYLRLIEGIGPAVDRFIVETQAISLHDSKKALLRIIAMPVDDGGCGWYRVRQPMKMVQGHTEHDTHVSSTGDDMGQLTQALTIADVAVVRQGGEDGMRRMRQIPEFRHLKWVLDLDDAVDLISPYSEHYREYGLADYFDQNSNVQLWKDGVNGFNLERNRQRVDSLLRGIREADLVSVSTPVLAEWAKQFNANVAVLPNCVDTSVWFPLEHPERETLRVGWSGGVTHYEDWYQIREPLNELLRTHRFTLVMVGSHYPGLIDEDNRDLVEVWPWVPFPAHSWRMMCLQLDAAIIPLADLPFNRYKSAVKWYEFSAMGVPSVVANLTPYKEEIENAKTAVAYDDSDEFYHCLEQVLENNLIREEVGRNAREWVIANRDAKVNAHLWADAYSQLT